ncbi:MAG: MMPL family transporter [Alphaproteobacteria bacterium]|nr:MMPL family transporter [Alphaproteobacteria bacterium]
MTKPSMQKAARTVFLAVTQKPKLTLAIGFLFVVLSAAGMVRLVKDTSVDAFIPEGHPSVVARDRAQAIFGLKDPIVIGVDARMPGGVYKPEVLSTLRAVEAAVATIDNIRDDRIISLLTETAIYGADDALNVEDIDNGGAIDMVFAERVQTLAGMMPPYEGTLVAYDGSSALVIAEMRNQKIADRTYQDVVDVLAGVPAPGIDIHVAGQGAVGGYLSRYIDSDSRKMQPVVVGTILLVLFVAFLRLKSLVGPLLVIAAAALGSVGVMAWFGVPYYAITSALPVVILSIAVADSIHVLTAYYELRARQPDLRFRAAVVIAMEDMWVPVTLTTLTTAAGFIGLAASSIMPPIMYFGIFAALGVVLAWAFTMFVLPAAILLMKLERSPMFRAAAQGSAGRIGHGLTQVALFSARNPAATLVAVLAVSGIIIWGAMGLRVDRAQVDNFRADEPIRIADDHINAHFAGTSYLDVIVETEEMEGLLDGNRMKRVLALQDFLEGLPHVAKTVSIANYLEQMHRALNVENEEAGRLPESGDAIAQYLLLYEASADPTDFEEEIDRGYQTLLVRAYLNTDYFSEERTVVERLERYLEVQFNGAGLKGTTSGRVNVDYHWMKSLGESHFVSVAISLALVGLVSSLLFRSVADGLIALAPVFLTIVGIYALMSAMGVYLEPATSMFAAISIGVGVDFSIHLIDRLKLGLGATDQSVADVVANRFPHAARACFFNAAALGLGFCVLLISELPTLQRFGALVAFSCLVSFLAALVIVPMAWGLRERLARLPVFVRS